MPVFLVWMPQKCNLPNVNAKNANLPNVGEEFVKCFSIPAVRPAVLRGRVVVDYGSRSVRALAQPPNPICTPSPLIPPSFQSLLNPALPCTFWIFIAPTQTFFYCLLTSSLPSTLFCHVLQAVLIKLCLSPRKRIPVPGLLKIL